MPVKIHKPTSPGRRKSSGASFEEITRGEPERSLVESFGKRAGRNAQGKITVRHQGGGAKQLYRLVDFRQDRLDQPAKVLGIEYDPNRSARIALIEYEGGERRYIIAPVGLEIGATVVASRTSTDVHLGNRLELKRIPVGTAVHNVELVPGKGGEVVRSAGSAATVMSAEGDFVQLKMPSGEIRRFFGSAMASVGQVSNPDHSLVRFGKAGRRRWLGQRPSVRGKAMNPVDHPHGGGEGNQPIGLTGPKTPWGKPALGPKTRRRHKHSNRFIVQRRK